MTRRPGWLGLLLLAGCSKLTAPKGEAVALELRLPVPAAVEPGDTLRLQARALDAQGDSIDVPIYWRVADTTLILVDSTGLVTTTLSTGSGRVQARSGKLLSTLTSGQLAIHPRSDTLVLLGPLVDTIQAGDTSSAILDAAVQSFAPAGGVADQRILYEVVDTALAQGKVRFSGGGLQLRVATSTTGQATPSVRLFTVAGQTPPASLTVRISATRPSGTPVPGSGQIFTLLFP